MKLVARLVSLVFFSLIFAALGWTTDKWDLGRDFPMANQASSPWRLGSYDSHGNFDLFTTYVSNHELQGYPEDPLTFWCISSLGASIWQEETTADYMLGIEPGQVSLDCDSGTPVARWTAPYTGTFTIAVTFGGSTAKDYVNQTGNANVLAAGVIADGQTITPTWTSNNLASFQLSQVILTKGTNIDAFVDQRKGGGNTQTKFVVVGNETSFTMSLAPTAVRGGSPSTGSITLLAPTGQPTTFDLYTSSAATATVPATVTVPAGSSTIAFPINTLAVSAAKTVTIKAVGGTTTVQAYLTVDPTTLTSLTIAPGSVYGGSPPTGTIVIGSPAPTGGLSISISSSQSFATAPTTVVVPAGQSVETFQCATLPVSATASATLTATLGTQKATATMKVLTPVPVSLYFAPTSVYGSVAATGTLTINAPAPTGGLAVALSSGQACLAPPATVVIPAGKTVGTFQCSTNPVAASTTGMVTASHGGGTAQGSLAVIPPILVGITLQNYGDTGSNVATVTLNAPAPAGGIVVSISYNPSSYAIECPTSVTVPAGATSANTSTMYFQPTGTQLFEMTVTATLNSISYSATFTLTNP